MNKLTLIVSLLLLAYAVTANAGSVDRTVSPEVRRELSGFGPYGAFASIVDGIGSDERIIFLKTPIGSFRLPTSQYMYTYFGPLRAPSTGFSPEP